MSQDLAGFQHWEVELDREGRSVKPAEVDAFVAEVASRGVKDLFIFSHGWNNDPPTARRLYSSFFGQLRDVMKARGIPQDGVGTCGIIWPSIRWPDEEAEPKARAAASLETPPPPSDADVIRELAKVFDTQEEKAALEEMQRLLAERSQDPAALARFQKLLASLGQGEAPDDTAEDDGERALLEEAPEKVFEALASVAPKRRAAAAGLTDRLWDGAKEALRGASYWQMKKRAGLVGKKGVGSLVARLGKKHPALRIHLLGHSFGARVVSFSLKRLPAEMVGPASPVKSLLLLQGAFSHFAFADVLPHDTSRSGALKGMARKVDGPLLITHSKRDTAVGVLYPKASFLQRSDAAALDGKPSRWGAMGSDGAQAVNAQETPFKRVGETYTFSKAGFLNLDGNRLITKGGPPSGAHSDIVYPEIAWALLSASGLVR